MGYVPEKINNLVESIIDDIKDLKEYLEYEDYTISGEEGIQKIIREIMRRN